MTILFKQALQTSYRVVEQDDIVRIDHLLIEVTDEVINGCECRILAFYYQLAFNGYETSAYVKTDVTSHNCGDYQSDYDIQAFHGREYMNDVPKLCIDSIACFDNHSGVTIALHCEMTKVILTDYHTRKHEYLLSK